jgi:hypothetical protein
MKKIGDTKKSTKEKSRKPAFHLPKKPRKNTVGDKVAASIPI